MNPHRPMIAAAALLLVVSAAVSQLAAQQTSGERRTTAEEMTEARRLWLEQQRLGDSASVWAPSRGVRGPQPAWRMQQGEIPGLPQLHPYGAAPPAYAPLGSSHGWSGWCAVQLRGGPYSPYGGAAAYGPTAPFGVYGPSAPYGPNAPYAAYGRQPQLALDASCLLGGMSPGHPLPGYPSMYGPPRAPRRSDPGYPPVNRFHSRFFGEELRGPYPDYGVGMHVLPPDPWRPPPWYWGVMPRGCAQLSAESAAGAVMLQVPLPALGASTPEELELVIDGRLSRGLPVQIEALDGRLLRLAPGAELERLAVTRCTTDGWR